MEKIFETILVEFDALWGGADPDSQKQIKWRKELAKKLADAIESESSTAIKCDFRDCNNEAEFEGWYRVLDFSNIPTGRIQKMCVCSSCTKYLIGYDKFGEEVK